MSEHAWVIDNLAAYIAGGLDADECERVDIHIASCEPCAAALQDVRAFDHGMDSLFAPTRPAPALEDRIIQVFRVAAKPRSQPHWGRKLAWGAAATVALGATGAGMSRLSDGGGLPFPGDPLSRQLMASNDLRPIQLSPTDDGRSIPDKTYLAPFIEQDNLYAGEVQTKGRHGWREGESTGDRVLGFFPPSQGAFPNGEKEATPVVVTDGVSNSLAFDAFQDAKIPIPNAVNTESVLRSATGYGFGGSPNQFYMTDGTTRYGPSLTTGNFQPSSGGGLGGGMGMTGGSGTSALTGVQVQPGGGRQDPGSTVSNKTGGETLGSDWGKAEGKSRTWKEDNKPQITDGDDKKSRLQAPITAPGSTAPPPAVFVPDAHRAKAHKESSDGKELKDGEKVLAASSPQQDSTKGTAGGQGQADPKKPQQPAQEQTAARKVIRSGDIEFEVPSFDSAAAAVTKLVTNIKGAFIGTINSDKLPNGKVRGSLVVRVPPDALDGLVLDLRRELGKDGELKGLKIGSQDITKQYYDLESRLKAAKTMQERLLKIIADGKGEIKQLLEAEKELGVWRTKIEEFEGEIRYYNSVVSLSTLNVHLAEKEIRAAVDVVEREVVETGIEVEDVDKAREATLTTVADAKGRVTKAELKQFAAGQYNATLNFEVPADKAGAIRDRLRQIGTMVRLEINRTQQAEGGQATRDAKIRRGDAVFAVSIYNITGMGVRETTNTQIAAPDVPVAYRGLQDAVAKVKGQTITAQLNEQDRNNITANLTFEVRRADDAAVQAALTAAGETVSRNVIRAQANQNITDAKVRYQVDLKDVTQLAVRETTTLKLASQDVPATYRSLQEVVAKVKGRIVRAQLNEQDRNNITAEFAFEIRRADEEAVRAALAAGGEVISRAVGRSDQKQDVTDSRVRYETTLYNANAIPPRETYKLLIETNDVEATAAVFASFVKEAGGRILGSEVGRERDGRSTALLAYEVPLLAEPTVLDQLKKGGKVHAQQSIRNPQAPDGKLATARINLTLVGTDSIVPQDEGFWPKVRGGLGTSVRFLLFSVSWIIFGVLVLLPWALVGYGAYRLGRKMFAPAPTLAPAVTTTVSTPPSS
jgi:hypothetical protein